MAGFESLDQLLNEFGMTDDQVNNLLNAPPERCHYCHDRIPWGEESWTDEDDNIICRSCYENSADMAEEEPSERT